MSKAYPKGLVNPVEGFDSPFPVAILHNRLGNGLDPAEYFGLAQFKGRGPVRVEAPAHVADLMSPLLKWGNSAADKRPQEIICC